MRKSRKILKLLLEKDLGAREAARSCGVSHSTVLDYSRRAEKADLSWAMVDSMDSANLEAKLFPAAPGAGRPTPDWSVIHEELQKKGVTLQLLWDEHKAVSPEGYQYSRFCELYGQWRGRLDLSLRQHHRAGEKLFVDYCGQTVPVHDPMTGDSRSAEIFVAVLGASNYTYAEATWTQSLPDWVGSHIRAFEYIGGVAEILVPDNLKSGVKRPSRYEPELNRTYEELATHYETAIIPARVRKPKDKAKVETGVLVVERWILACLRHRKFFSLEELNDAVRDLLERLNNRPFKKLPGTRRSQFEALDAPALKPLPEQRFEYADWQWQRVRKDYHVPAEGHYYSVPFQLVGRKVEIRTTSMGVEVLHHNERVACHVRSHEAGGSTTLKEHMPPSHRHYAEWTPQRLAAWSETTGPSTVAVVEAILDSKAHPLQGLQACLGLRRLEKGYGPERLEAACQRALEIQGLSLRSIRSILEHGLDKIQPPKPEPEPVIDHGNIRGAAYYGLETSEEMRSC